MAFVYLSADFRYANFNFPNVCRYGSIGLQLPLSLSISLIRIGVCMYTYISPVRIPFYIGESMFACVFFFFPFDRLNYSNGEKGASSVYTEKASIYLYNVCNSLAWRLHHHLFLWKSNHSCFFYSFSSSFDFILRLPSGH